MATQDEDGVPSFPRPHLQLSVGVAIDGAASKAESFLRSRLGRDHPALANRDWDGVRRELESRGSQPNRAWHALYFLGSLDDLYALLRARDEALMRGEDSDLGQILFAAIQLGEWASLVELELKLAHDDDIHRLIGASANRLAGNRKGGHSTRTPDEVIELGRRIFEGEKAPGVSNEAALQRTSAKLERQHGIEVCARTLRRHLLPVPDNA